MMERVLLSIVSSSRSYGVVLLTRYLEESPDELCEGALEGTLTAHAREEEVTPYAHVPLAGEPGRS